MQEHKASIAQATLLSYMEIQSEERWCAGWLSDLHIALLGDESYEWLVEASGGWFVYRDEFVSGTLSDLRLHAA